MSPKVRMIFKKQNLKRTKPDAISMRALAEERSSGISSHRGGVPVE